MAFDFTFPDVGEGIHEGRIVRWIVKEGDSVKADQPLAEVETDKAVVEIPSPKNGKITKLYHGEGDVIKVGEVLATIEEAVSATKSARADQQAQTQEKKESTGVVGSLEPTAAGVMKAPSLTQSGAVFEGSVPAGVPQKMSMEPATPASKTFQKAAVKAAGPSAKKKYDGPIETASYSGVRKTVGEQMVLSATKIPQVTHIDMADMTKLWKIREKEKIKAEKEGIKLTFLAFILKAVVASLKKHPYINAELNEAAEEIVLKKYYNLGIAVDTDAGLMVPVIKGAEQKSIFQFAKEIGVLAEKSRTRKIGLEDLKGGTFTITNVGSVGGMFATPIIHYPEVAILGVGTIQDTPVVQTSKSGVQKGGQKIVVRKMMGLFLSYDHRVVDGAEAARFMNTVKEHLEDPDLMLVEE